jgi:drug/metabolite transporter (DMT)-like permease
MPETNSNPAYRSGDNVGLGIALMLAAVLIFGIQDAISKVLLQTYSPFQVAMVRYWGFAAFSLWLVSREVPLRQAFQSRRRWVQIGRGVLLIADIWLFAGANRTVPLAELQSISLIHPMLVTLFAIPLLGERVGPFRIGAVLAGFIGALIIVRPGGLPITGGVLLVIASSTCYALYIILTRMVSGSDGTATSMVYVGVVGFIMSSAVGVFFWQSMDWFSIGLITVLTACTCVAHGLMMHALSMVPASVLQPFSYASLPWAITLSFVVFGHLIDPVSLVGAAIIAAAGLVVWARERMRAPAR